MSDDVASLVLRLGLGAMIVVHGWNKVRGPGGLAGTSAWFEGLGLRPGWLHARLAAGTELAAGLMLIVGLGSPLACAALVGLMVVAGLTDHRGKGFFVFKGGWEYVAVVAVAATSLAILGPGRWSVDHLAQIDAAGPAWGVSATAAGSAAALLLLAVARRPERAART